MNIKAPRGTKDIFGEVSVKFQEIILASNVFKQFNFEQIITPIFESTDLFVRGIGETTDIVEKEMYTFEDKGGRSLTLRPEGTASVARAYGEHKMYQEGAKKFFYFGPMFRYERPQAGRYREFYQMGVEVIGESSSLIDAEVIFMADKFLKTLSIENYSIELNTLGCGSCRAEYQIALKAYLNKFREHLCDDCKRRLETNPLRVLDCKVESCRVHFVNAPTLEEYLDEECKEHFEGVKTYLTALGIKFNVNSKLVRGLDYYNRTVFEFVSQELGAQGTILGGGRYNNLVGEICGGVDQPAIGFAAGMERMAMLMPTREIQTKKIAICWLGTETALSAMKTRIDLSDAGYITDMSYDTKSFKAQFKRANKEGVDFAVIIGSDEYAKGVVKIKNFKTEQECEVEMSRVVEYFKGV